MFENPIEIIARSYFESEKVVSHYFCEGHRVGLWQSEKALFTSLFSKTDRILDLGCGAGRIAFGLEHHGFEKVIGADFSTSMVEGARQIAEGTGSGVAFQQADARALPWQDGEFDGVIFGFNGFFMIPGHEERLKALKEVHRVLRSGGRFVFSGHDRSLKNQRVHWREEAREWTSGNSKARGVDFGDVIAETNLGTMFIHSTSTDEVAGMLEIHGFENVETWLRSELANESPAVRVFSDECRFWKAEKAS